VSFSDRLIFNSLYIIVLELHPYAAASSQTVAKEIMATYYDIAAAVKSPNKPMIYEISFDFSTQTDISIVYTLTTERDFVRFCQC
jgi:predicted double-glycine peptidase